MSGEGQIKLTFGWENIRVVRLIERTEKRSWKTAMENCFYTIDRKLHGCVHEATKNLTRVEEHFTFLCWKKAVKSIWKSALQKCWIVLALVKHFRGPLEGSHGYRYFEISAHTGSLVKLTQVPSHFLCCNEEMLTSLSAWIHVPFQAERKAGNAR